MIPLVYLMCAILNITVFKGNEYSHMAATQRTNQTEISRGIITDRNMIPLTGTDIRYTDSSLARHVIGYTDSYGDGISGIEKDFDDELSSNGKGPYSSLKDANGNEIPNFKTDDFKTNQKYVKLTLDYHIQNIVENVLDKNSTTGAAVVLDTGNFDILAVASRPNFDQNDVAQYINSGGTALVNRAVTPYKADELCATAPLLFTKTEITPLQAAQLACTVAAKGIRKESNIVGGIALENGYIIKSMRNGNQKRILPKTVTKEIKSEISGEIWAIGYFPYENPQYAMSVLSENDASANKIYNEIKKRILALNIQ
ncbi:MAG: hypothetical protein IJN62_06330 [Clostridia bacterium]|nr:hypothetical protein [Clostridia bacterium]